MEAPMAIEREAKKPVRTETWSGRVVDLQALRSDDVDPMDLAVGLSRTFRFNGATIRPWSVAEHSLVVAQKCEEAAIAKDKPRARLYGLLHDAHEVYIGDLTRTLQRLLSAEANQQIEAIRQCLDYPIFLRFGLSSGFVDGFRKTLRDIDDRVAKTEALELLPGGGACWDWFNVSPYPGRISMQPLSMADAAAQWLRAVTMTSEEVCSSK